MKRAAHAFNALPCKKGGRSQSGHYHAACTAPSFTLLEGIAGSLRRYVVEEYDGSSDHPRYTALLRAPKVKPKVSHGMARKAPLAVEEAPLTIRIRGENSYGENL